MALLLLIGSVSLMFIFTGCDRGPENGPPADMDVYFLVNGADDSFVLVDDFDVNTRSIAIPENQDPNDVVNAAVIRRNALIEDQIGARIHMRTRTHAHNVPGGMLDYLTPLFANGISDYHVISGHQFFSITKIFEAGEGLFVNFNGLTSEESALQLEQPWWDDQRIGALEFNGASWFITGHISQSWIAGVYVSIVNRRIWEEHANVIAGHTGGISNIYDIVREGLWTLDLWTTLASSTGGIFSGAGARAVRGDTVAYLSHVESGSWGGFAMSVGAGIPYTIMEGNLPRIGLQDPRANAIAERINELYFVSAGAYISSDASPGNMFDVFREGNSLMMISMLQNVEVHLVEEGFEDGVFIVPVPKFNSAQANYYSVVHDLVALFSIPVIHFGDIRALTSVLELMAELSYRYVYPAYYTTTLKRLIIGGEHDDLTDMLQIARRGIQTCFNTIWAARLSPAPIFVLRAGQQSFPSHIRTNINGWNLQINSLLVDLQSAVDQTNINMARARQELNAR